MLFAKYPYPPQLRQWLIGLFASAMGSMVLALLLIVAKLLGADLSNAQMKAWVVPLFAVSTFAFGGLFAGMAVGIFLVNAHRDGKRQKFITPAKYEISESASPLEYRLYAAFLLAMGVGFGWGAAMFLML